MAIKIYNSLTKKKEEFIPFKSPHVNMYTCGVTTYDKCHIGHARSLYVFDIIRRYLTHRGFKVNFIRNITDIDDKIINKAKELGKKWQELSQENIAFYREDLEKLGIENIAEKEPRASENVKDMIAHIEGLIKKGYAYEVDGDVYFSVRKFESYGKLSGQSIEQILEAVRIDKDEKKKDPVDFALWKKSNEGETFWDSPWGNGRPGWHIECSVMSLKHLGCDTIDIHGGGRDLIFPHHENEIAQTESLTGKPFARHWIHHGLLTINGQKMSKSLGNFITIGEILDKYPSDILKILFLQTHYSSPVDFSWEKMEEIKRAYESIDILMGKLEDNYDARDLSKVISGGAGLLLPFNKKFQECMDDDFNTPKALSVLFDLVNRCNATLDGNKEDKQFILRSATDIMKEIFDIFGLGFFKNISKVRSDSRIKELVNFRSELKRQKKYDEADRIRAELEEEGIILEDTKERTTWRRKI